MTKTAQNLTMRQGEYKVLRIPIVDAAGAAVALDGGSARWVLYGASVLLTKTSAVGGGITIDTVNKRLDITLNAVDTAAIAPGAYYHQAMVTLNGHPGVVTEGTLNLQRNEAD